MDHQFEGIFNFRDLGGHPAAGGRRVRRGLLFRSDDLSILTDRDKEKLEALGLATVIDFRDEGEAEALPDWIPSSAINTVHLPIDAGSLMGVVSSGRLTRAKTMGMMISVYRSLANDFQSTYREFFEVVGDRRAAPLLFHCTAGKDRTGFASAMLLSALGVDRALVMDDYLASKACMARKYRLNVDYDSVMEPLYTVLPEFLQASFEAIDGKYDGVEAYLRNQLGVDSGALREMYTESAS